MKRPDRSTEESERKPRRRAESARKKSAPSERSEGPAIVKKDGALERLLLRLAGRWKVALSLVVLLTSVATILVSLSSHVPQKLTVLLENKAVDAYRYVMHKEPPRRVDDADDYDAFDSGDRPGPECDAPGFKLDDSPSRS